MTNTNWQDSANCIGHPAEVFFPELKSGCGKNAYKKAFAKAYELCLNCEVANECYWCAVKNDEQYGMWGGVNFQRRYRYGVSQRKRLLLKDRQDFIKQYKKQKENNNVR